MITYKDLEVINIPLSRFLCTKYILYSLLALISPNKFKRKLKTWRFHIKNNKFSNIFSLGDRCATADFLIKTNLRAWSSPFDWMGGGNLPKRINLITSGFSNFLLKENLISYNEIDVHGKYRVDDTISGFRFRHDFSSPDISLDYSDIYEKYQRRINRMYKKSAHGSVLIFYIETQSKSPDLTDFFLSKLSEIKQSLRADRVTVLYCHSSNQTENCIFQKFTPNNNTGSVFKLNIYHGDDYSNKPLSKEIELIIFRATHKLFELA